MSFRDDTLDPANQELLRETQSHNAEIRRIADALGTAPVIEDIIKAIKQLKSTQKEESK